MWFLCLLSILFSIVAADEYGPKRCAVPKLYTELACKPFYDDNSDCPSRFDCGVVSRNVTKCYYKGVVYNVQERLKDDPRNPCRVACICDDYDTEGARWMCAIFDCGMPPRDTCKKYYPQFSLDKCCPKYYCYSEEEPPVAKCEYNGKTYLDGQYIETDLPCTRCICQPDFNGTLDGPWCRDEFCALEIDNSAELRKGCVPIYQSSNVVGCCPSQFRCPTEDDFVIESGDINSDYKCKFGNLTLNIGDKLSLSSGDNYCSECSCSIPPFISCIHKKCST